jgi:hypothetical protein
MKLKQIGHVLAISIAGICTSIPASQATPIGTDTLHFNGAVFTLTGEWTDDRYVMTYLANFSGFQGDSEASYLKAIDWNWEGTDFSSVSLKEAPGGTDQWRTQTSHQIGTGYSLGCEPGYNLGAVCTEFLGDTKGFATTTELSELRWVFEVNISYKYLRQTDRFLGDSLRAAFVNGSGSLAAPIMSCSGAQNPGCPDQRIALQALAEDNGTVPIPGVPALLLAGIAGMFMSRRRRRGLKG